MPEKRGLVPSSEQGDKKKAVLKAFEDDLHLNSVTIEEPREFAEPEIRYEAFGDIGSDIEKSVRGLYEWLKAPYVQDQFSKMENGHDLRRNWRDKMEKKYKTDLGNELKKIFHGNKFSGNGRSVVFMKLYNLKSKLEKTPKFGKLAQNIAQIEEEASDFSGADGWDVKQLRKETEKLEDVVCKIIKTLSQASKK